MHFTYRIFHGEDSKSEVDSFFNPLSDEQLEHEYANFATALRLHYLEKTIEASCTSDTSNGRGIIVSLETDDSESEAYNTLNQLLRKLNNYTKGLCLIAKKIK